MYLTFSSPHCLILSAYMVIIVPHSCHANTAPQRDEENFVTVNRDSKKLRVASWYDSGVLQGVAYRDSDEPKRVVV